MIPSDSRILSETFPIPGTLGTKTKGKRESQREPKDAFCLRYEKERTHFLILSVRVKSLTTSALNSRANCPFGLLMSEQILASI